MSNVKLTKEEINAILILMEDRATDLKEEVLYLIEEFGFGSEPVEECTKEYLLLESASTKLVEAKNVKNKR